MNYSHKFLQEQIITYLGNKRKLIGFIDNVVDEIIFNDVILKNKNKKEIVFFDIFAGSGVVSRYSKLKGFTTYTNDLEIYSHIIQKSLIGTNSSNINDIFQNSFNNLISKNIIKKELIVSNDTYQSVLNFLNSLKEPKKVENKYWSINYAPKNTKKPDFEKERLFYTQENALKIDAIVEIIENKNLFSQKEKEIIQTSLMYCMTININTSGTMKGFHNGWGGHGKNALSRILSEIKLVKLPLIEGQIGKHFNDYAEKVFNNNNIEEVDIIYADPPYNQHQYSANYNHLTTLIQNDKYNPGNVSKGSRAGIRIDHNRSDFCKSTKNSDNIKLAEEAFNKFINNIKTKYIILSYNNEGVISIDKLIDILSCDLKNSIKIEYKIHDKFKGGKATQTSNKVIEYLIIINMKKSQSKEEFIQIKNELIQNTEKKLFTDKYINIYEFVNFNNEFEFENNNNEVILLKNKIECLRIDKKSLKTIKENLEVLNNEEIECLKKYEMDYLKLMQFYIDNKNIELATKLLRYFKIKKYENELKKFKTKIDELKKNI